VYVKCFLFFFFILFILDVSFLLFFFLLLSFFRINKIGEKDDALLKMTDSL